jgi:hypothetical protein
VVLDLQGKFRLIPVSIATSIQRTESDMIETGQIIFLVLAIIAFGALAASPSWWTGILLAAVLGAWAFSQIRKKRQRK